VSKSRCQPDHDAYVDKHGNRRCRTCRNAYDRERRATDPEYRERMYLKSLASGRKRYATDPVYRERVKASTRARRAERTARERERYRTDPEYRARVLAYQREWRAAKKRPGSAQR
jgi:hypothetical protein